MGIAVFPAASGGVTPKVSTFTSTGTFTAPSNCQYVEVFLVGGGGGGGSAQHSTQASAQGGGGGGGTVINWRKLPVTPGQAYTVTIGAGGTGSSSSAAGSNGSDTTFGSLATAWGGGGGGSRSSASGNVFPLVRGTSGGLCGNNVSFAAGGGGANPFTFGIPNSTNPFQINESTGAQSGVMIGGMTNGTQNFNGFQFPGFGIDGFGGGGQGGSQTTTNPSWRTVSFSGGGFGGTQDGNNDSTGTAGTANTGGGGGGGSQATIGATTKAGGNGGSGYAIVVYWS